MRNNHPWNEARSRKISMSVWSCRKFRSQTQPLGYFHLAWCLSPQDLEMAARALSGIQTAVSLPSSLTRVHLPGAILTTCPCSKQPAAWVGSNWPHLIYTSAYSTLAVGSLLWTGEEISRCPSEWWRGSDTHIQPSYMLRLDKHLHCLPVYQLHN